MFSQSADQPATDESPAPVGMRELPPQPAKPVMPAYGQASPEPVAEAAGPGPDDSVIAVDDHFEGTFTSRGTVVVMGSVKGRIEAVRVRIEESANVEADVIVDEAIIAGAFNGNLTCRERLEARASGRINGRVETHKLMLHEGAAVEGEMHMLTDTPRDPAETIRGTASPRGGEAGEGATTSGESAAKASGSGARAVTAADAATPVGRAATTTPAQSVAPSSAATTTPAQSVAPSSAAKPAPPAVGSSTGPSTEASSSDSASATRRSVAETLRAESLRVAPRTSTSVSSYSGGPTSAATATRTRNGTTPTGF